MSLNEFKVMSLNKSTKKILMSNVIEVGLYIYMGMERGLVWEGSVQ